MPKSTELQLGLSFRQWRAPKRCRPEAERRACRGLAPRAPEPRGALPRARDAPPPGRHPRPSHWPHVRRAPVLPRGGQCASIKDGPGPGRPLLEEACAHAANGSRLRTGVPQPRIPRNTTMCWFGSREAAPRRTGDEDEEEERSPATSSRRRRRSRLPRCSRSSDCRSRCGARGGARDRSRAGGTGRRTRWSRRASG